MRFMRLNSTGRIHLVADLLRSGQGRVRFSCSYFNLYRYGAGYATPPEVEGVYTSYELRSGKLCKHCRVAALRSHEADRRQLRSMGALSDG